MQEIVLRRMTSEDADSVFLWRNDPRTRAFFFDPRQLSRHEHVAWFRSSLRRRNRVMLIGEAGGVPIGVLRYDIRGEEVDVDVYLVPGLYGKGLGTRLLRAGNEWLRLNLPKVDHVVAKVMQGNIASHKAFLKAGFIPRHTVYGFSVR